MKINKKQINKMENSFNSKVDENSNKLLGKKTKKPSGNDSFSSNSIGFQVDQTEDEVFFEFKHISSKTELQKQLSLIRSPCLIKNEELIDKIFEEKKNQINHLNYPNLFLKIIKMKI